MSSQDAWGTLKQLTSADIKGTAPDLLSSSGFRQQLQKAVQVGTACNVNAYQADVLAD